MHVWPPKVQFVWLVWSLCAALMHNTHSWPWHSWKRCASGFGQLLMHEHRHGCATWTYDHVYYATLHNDEMRIKTTQKKATKKSIKSWSLVCSPLCCNRPMTWWRIHRKLWCSGLVSAGAKWVQASRGRERRDNHASARYGATAPSGSCTNYHFPCPVQNKVNQNRNDVKLFWSLFETSLMIVRWLKWCFASSRAGLSSS